MTVCLGTRQSPENVIAVRWDGASMTRRINIDLDEATHKALKKIAQSQASRLKPFAELVLKRYVEDHIAARLRQAQENDHSHIERLGRNA